MTKLNDRLNSCGVSPQTRQDGREERGERTAVALLAAARSAFSEHGYGAASVRDIAGRAGANPASVRYHFGNKEALYRAVIDDAMTTLRLRLAAAFAQPGLLRERAHRVLDAYLDHLAAQPDFPRLVQRGVLDGDSIVLELAQDHLRPLFKLIDAKTIGALAIGPAGSVQDVILSLFGAAVAPYLYAPLVTEALGADVLSSDALQRRRKHLATLIDLSLGASSEPQ